MSLLNVLYNSIIMAQFSFQIPDAKETAIIDAWCVQEGYQEMVTDGNGGLTNNPETKTQFAKRTLKRYFTLAYVRQQGDAARVEAESNALDEV